MRKRTRARLAGVVVLGGGMLLIGGTAGAQGVGCPSPSLHPRAEANMVRAINAARRDAGVRPLRVNGRLRATARRTSARMTRRSSLKHDGLRWARGYSAGQNLVRAGSVGVAFRGQQASATHRANLTDPAWRTVGVGVARGCRASLYFTINFSAAPR